MTPGRLIAITGPAAVGKSTVARALQAELSRTGDLWLVVELDVFARALSRQWIAVGERAGREANTIAGGLDGFNDEHRSILWGERRHTALARAR